VSGCLDSMRTTTIPRPVVTDPDPVPYLEETAPALVAELLDLVDQIAASDTSSSSSG
jgi:hypothetical protein